MKHWNIDKKAVREQMRHKFFKEVSFDCYYRKQSQLGDFYDLSLECN